MWQRQEEAVLNEKKVLAAISSNFVIRLEQTYQSPTELHMLLELVRGGALSYIMGDPLSELTAKFYVASAVLITTSLHIKVRHAPTSRLCKRRRCRPPLHPNTTVSAGYRMSRHQAGEPAARQ